MQLIQLYEQRDGNIPSSAAAAIVQHLNDGIFVEYSFKRKNNEEKPLILNRNGENIHYSSSYFIGLQWLKENNEIALQINPKMNDSIEIDYVKMLNDALKEIDNAEYLKDLLEIDFKQPTIKINQKEDLLSIFLIIEYLRLLQIIVQKGLKKSFHNIEENLHNKAKGRILVSKTIKKNHTKGKFADNIRNYQVHDVNSIENQILKKALYFASRLLKEYKLKKVNAELENIIQIAKPYFENVSDNISIRAIKAFKGNPLFKEYSEAVKYAQLLLRRFSYDITKVGNKRIETPPHWIDMSKLFELYVLHHLRKIYNHRNEVIYHPKANCQELDYLLMPDNSTEPYVVDAKYKPKYKDNDKISKDDARQVAGYARLRKVYEILKLDPEKALPIKCLIIYPDQDMEDHFTFNRNEEHYFTPISDYIRIYKTGIRLPVILRQE